MTIPKIRAGRVAAIGLYANTIPPPRMTPMAELKRWYTAAYRADNGNVIPVGVEYVKIAWAEQVRDEWKRDDPTVNVFIAYRDVPNWTEITQ